MQRSMTYVIGVGGAGVDVVEKLHQRRVTEDIAQDAPGLMAIDSDGERLDELPAELPTIYLTSDDGVISNYAAGYPFLPSNLAIPTDTADRRRHIGRYKFDNGASPEYENYYQEVKTVLERFFDDQSTSLSQSSKKATYSVVLVTSLGGGTGSGTFPLLTTVLDHVANGFESLRLQIFGIGIVPSLDFDLERGFPSTEPAIYPNTYGALRNLSTLLDVGDGEPLQLPVYSTVDPTTLDADSDPQEAVESNGTVFEIASSPLDGFWLVSTAQGSSDRESLRDGMESALSIVTGAIDALDRCEMGVVDRLGSLVADGSPPFGAVGYATLCVPHKELRAYCKRKRDRETLVTRLNQERSRLETLREERDRLASSLSAHTDQTAADSWGWVDQIRHRLGCASGDETDFILETTASEFEDILDEMLEEYRPGLYLELLTVMERILSEGDLQQAVKSNLEGIYQSIWSRYETDLIENDRQPQGNLGNRFECLEALINEQIEACQRQLGQTDYGVRDLLPLDHDLLTSERERLETRLEQLRTDAERVSEASSMFEAFQAKRSAVEQRLSDMRSDIHSRLEELETELRYAKQRRDDLQDELSACDTDLASYRQSLTSPEKSGSEFVLPLNKEVLTDLTLDELDAKCTSITAYRDLNLLACDRAELIDYVEQCIDYSRNWPDAIVEHDPTKVVAPRQNKTQILCNKANKSLIANLFESFSTSDTLSIASDSELGFRNRPFSIDVVSTARKGRPESLLGYQWLEEQAADGIFDAYNTYDDYRLALTYLEWYEFDISDMSL